MELGRYAHDFIVLGGAWTVPYHCRQCFKAVFVGISASVHGPCVQVVLAVGVWREQTGQNEGDETLLKEQEEVESAYKSCPTCVVMMA